MFSDIPEIITCKNGFLDCYSFILLCWILSSLEAFGQMNMFPFSHHGHIRIKDQALGSKHTWIQPGLGSDTHLLCFWQFFHGPELCYIATVGLDNLSKVLPDSEVLSAVILNYCHLHVAGIASGCSSILWTGDIVGLPSTCPSNKARQPCRLAKAMQIILTGKEMLLCKRKNFNITQNYEPQNVAQDSWDCEYSLLLEEPSPND